MAKLDSKVVEGFDFNLSGMERINAENKVFDKLMEVSNNLPDGEVLGGVVSFPVADGHAHYLVVTDKPLNLRFIPYSDRYQAHPALIRGLTKKDVIKHLRSNKNLHEIFSGGKHV